MMNHTSPRPRQLFSRGKAESPAYRNLRRGTSPHARSGKAFCERLWEKFLPDADDNFRVEVRRNFYGRFWEMYLTCTLRKHARKRGYSVSCPKPGPDILLEHAGRRIWIEAVAASDGDPSKPDSVVEPSKDEAYAVPDEKIILRYTIALAEKYRKYCAYYRDGTVKSDDSYVIAINGFPLSYRWADGEIPRILKAVFPLGPLQIVFDRNAKEVVETKHQHRPTIYKATGKPVSTEFFANAEYASVSAILFSRANACMSTFPLGTDFLVVHNPHASHPIPHGLLSCREYWKAADKEELVGHDYHEIL